MEIHQIQYFLATVQAGSITAAARASRVSQPSLSVQLAKLEDELGGALFERGRKGASLTARGRAFEPHARAVLQRLEQALEESRAMDRLDRGRVVLGCLPITGAHLLPPVLKDFRKRWPGIQVELIEESSPRLAEALVGGDVDLAIVDEAGLGRGLVSETLFTEPLDLALPPGHPLTKLKRVSFSSLAGESMIMMKAGSGFREIVQKAFSQAGISPAVVMESGEIETVQNMVVSGLGLALVPRMVRKSGGPVYRPLVSPTPRRSLLLASRRAGILSPAAARLKDQLKRKLLKKSER